jgi:hypothetical protein|eukprot:scaffold283_cov194-Alexandrium_tamarense.AAC.26
MSSQPYYNADGNPPVVQGTVLHNTNHNNAHIYDHQHAGHGVGAMEIADPSQSQQFHQQQEQPHEGGNWTKGEHQPRRCNDAIFAVLFYVHLGVMGWVAGTFAPRMFAEVAASNGMNNQRDLVEDGGGTSDSSGMTSRVFRLMIQSVHSLGYGALSASDRSLQEENNYADVTGTNDFDDMLLLLGITGMVALVISTLALSFMIRHAEIMIKFALLFNIAASAVVRLMFTRQSARINN